LFSQTDTGNDSLGSVLKALAEEQSVDTTAIAVAWLLHHPSRILPVMGTNNIARINALGQAMTVTLSREQWFELYEAANGHEVP